ncbi:hypothetical protein WA026_016407 [Henosepilachna vigintioctopunctata]|uniref:Macro domain-containing protein n=1 Tax=Henosepilachna vigintioctopunctata TaxID=420089 RepID=A0AAW1UL54_9CUCU
MDIWESKNSSTWTVENISSLKLGTQDQDQGMWEINAMFSNEDANSSIELEIIKNKTYVTTYNKQNRVNTLSSTRINDKYERVVMDRGEIVSTPRQKQKKKIQEASYLPSTSHHKHHEIKNQLISITKDCHNINNFVTLLNLDHNLSKNSYNQSESLCYQRDKSSKSNNNMPMDLLFNYVNVKDDFEWVGFKDYMKSKSDKKGHFMHVIEQDMNLFTVGEDYSLAHCVAEDMKMGCGIAVQFRRRFPNAVLLNMREKSGGLIAVKHKARYIYYMVTKKISSGKPTYGTFWSSLKKLRDHMQQNQVKKLAIPRIGCGLDRLNWKIVKLMLEYLFRSMDVFILVCNFRQRNIHHTDVQKFSTSSQK